MFYSISGRIVFADATSVAIQTGGVAYKINTSLNTLQKTGGTGHDATLYTYLSVREDAMELYGFSTPDELDFFKMLMNVQSVGPKSALAILSVHTPESLIFAISCGDAKAISRAQGIGAKTAQRIILELKDKVTKMMPSEINATDYSMPMPAVGGNIPEAQAALIALGYSQSDAAKALSGADSKASVEELIRFALKKML